MPARGVTASDPRMGARRRTMSHVSNTDQICCSSLYNARRTSPLIVFLERRIETPIYNNGSQAHRITLSLRQSHYAAGQGTLRTCRLAFRLAAFLDERARFLSSWFISTPPGRGKSKRGFQSQHRTKPRCVSATRAMRQCADYCIQELTTASLGKEEGSQTAPSQYRRHSTLR